MLRRFLLIVLVALPASAATYFVELRDSARARFRSESSMKVIGEYSLAFSGLVIDTSATAAAALRNDPNILAVHEDHRILPFEPVTPVTRSAIAAVVHDARERVHASALPARGEGITVAVIDSGIDASHPALHVAGGWDFAQNDPDPEDIEGHGTHVAGIIAANGADILGVAPEVTLLAYKVVHVNGTGRESYLVAALERAMDPNGDGDPSDHVDVVNISLGWDAGPDSIGSRAVDAATAAGIVVVVAAGNEQRSPAQVKAPGVAPTAITIANALTETEVVGPSSRGPVPGTLAFKPDLAAPGENIISTYKGGGFASLSGTSMASPHVAGVAALLRELHPEWTPAEVKSALISTTRAMNGAPLARGAGFVDAQAAHEARYLINASGLSFGVNGAKSGTFDATRSFTIANHAQQPVTFTASAQSSPAGVSIAITPQTFTLTAGESRNVSVRLTANNSELAAPSDSLIGGAIRLQSSAHTLAVPWGLVRAARATITYDGVFTTVYATSSTRARLVYAYAPNAAEVYMTSGDVWDVVLVSNDGRVHIAESRPVQNDETIAFHAADASRHFTLDARAADDTPLRELPNYVAALRLVIDQAALSGDLFTLDGAELRVTPHSSRVHLAPLEAQLDPSHAYVVMHPELRGEGGLVTGNDYLHTRLQWASTRDVRAEVNAGYDTGGPFLSRVELASATSLAKTFDVYLTSRMSVGAFAALSFSGSTQIPMLRATSEGIAVGDGSTLSPAAHRAAGGSEIILGHGPAFPFGTSAFVGGFGEARDPERHWSLFDETGALVNQGSGDAPAFFPRARYVATSNVLRGELELVFGTQTNDLIAPTLTSLRVLDVQNALTEHLELGESAMLRFSAADLNADSSTKSSRPERTRVSYRAHGTITWMPLQVILEGTDLGSAITLGHMPAGDLYRTDLAPATASSNLIDLRIELEDAAGNRATWTQLRAFGVGDATPLPRRRAAGR